MKNFIQLLLSLIIVYSCNQSGKKSEHSITKIKYTIDTLLNNWHKDAAEANLEDLLNTMDSISIYIGTDASENWTKTEYEKFCKPYFDKGRTWDFTPLERNIYVSKSMDVVWFDELLDTWMGICRGSGVLEKTSNEWKIKHYVLSVTVPNDDIYNVIKTKSVNDSIFLKKNKNM